MARYRETDLFTNFKPDIVKIEIVQEVRRFKIRYIIFYLPFGVSMIMSGGFIG